MLKILKAIIAEILAFNFAVCLFPFFIGIFIVILITELVCHAPGFDRHLFKNTYTNKLIEWFLSWPARINLK